MVKAKKKPAKQKKGKGKPNMFQVLFQEQERHYEKAVKHFVRCVQKWALYDGCSVSDSFDETFEVFASDTRSELKLD